MAGDGTGIAPELAEAQRLLPIATFADPVLAALGGTHRSLSRSLGRAIRYQVEVAPFAAVHSLTGDALADLAELMEPREAVWIFGATTPPNGVLLHERTLPCLQMVLLPDADLPAENDAIERMGLADIGAMLDLIDVAYPGFFRRRTPEMGRYFGIRRGGQLVAMGGERMRLPGFAEVSGLCTHPEHRGQGYAASLMGHLARLHRHEGVISWLHVSATNTGAVALYERLGFRSARRLDLHQMRRPG